ncbi:MAG: iron hydrogenase small subunit [Lachnospiraceae bacterium]|nr:iron hydrogenase small subunit [Lachnospiraceae bacterium]
MSEKTKEKKMVNIKINGISFAVEEGMTILAAARQANIHIPTLCYLKEINEIGACRICVVEVKGARTLVTACVYPVSEGMEIFTNTPRVLNARRDTLKLILSDHDKECLSCVRSGSCELQRLCQEYNVDNAHEYEGDMNVFEPDCSAPHMVRDNNKCILCRRCVAACEQFQSVGVIGPNNRGFATRIGCAYDLPLGSTACVDCGQCIAVCPVGALYEKDDTEAVFEALADPEKTVFVQTAPAVRAALGEAFDYPVGTDTEGKMVAALRRLGFDGVYDTNFGADLTILEEAHEFLDRFKNGGKLPLITSCSPGWVKFCEHYFPDLTENLSSCKSPHQMQGALMKSYLAEKKGIDAKDIVTVSVMPCTAKKFERQRDDEAGTGYPDVDHVITTRELARMIRRAGIQFRELPDEAFDDPMGEYSGGGVIFGVSGGVMEAALRTAVYWITNDDTNTPVDFNDVRGMQGIKDATYTVGDVTVRVAVASGLSNARKLLNDVKSGKAQYDFIEIMGCPGGCINGGGQPQVPAEVRNFTDYREKRAKALYTIDSAAHVRKSHQNESLKKLYDEYLGEIGGEKAHHLLHTTYVKRGLYSEV